MGKDTQIMTPKFKIGGQWRFKKDLLDAWIAGKINSGGEKK